MNKKHSGFGIASFVISLINLFITFIVFVVAGVMEINTPGGISQNSSIAVVIGLFVILCILISFIGLIFGIVGVVDKTKKKVFSILGLVFNAFICLLIIATIIFGNSIHKISIESTHIV